MENEGVERKREKGRTIIDEVDEGYWRERMEGLGRRLEIRMDEEV